MYEVNEASPPAPLTSRCWGPAQGGNMRLTTGIMHYPGAYRSPLTPLGALGDLLNGFGRPSTGP